MRYLRWHNKLTCILSLCLAKRFFMERMAKVNVKTEKEEIFAAQILPFPLYFHLRLCKLSIKCSYFDFVVFYVSFERF